MALAILFSEYGIAMEAISETSVPLQNVEATMACVLSAIGVAFAYAIYAANVGREINSPSLVADAKHNR